MSHSRNVARILSACFRGNPRAIGADEQKAPFAKLPTACVVALSVVVLFGIAGAAWWAWFVSRGLTVATQKGSGTSVCPRNEAVPPRQRQAVGDPLPDCSCRRFIGDFLAHFGTDCNTTQ
jgi:hypothetical protein